MGLFVQEFWDGFREGGFASLMILMVIGIYLFYRRRQHRNES